MLEEKQYDECMIEGDSAKPYRISSEERRRFSFEGVLKASEFSLTELAFQHRFHPFFLFRD